MTRLPPQIPINIKILNNGIELPPIPIPNSYKAESEFGPYSDKSTNEYDLFVTAVAFHELERYLLQHKKARTGSIAIRIPITHSTLRDLNEAAVTSVLNELGLTIFSKDIRFELIPHSSYQTNFKPEMEEKEAVCLFSGGADSYVGVLDSKMKYDDIIALNIKHSKTTRLDGYLQHLEKNVLLSERIPLDTITVPKQISKGYSQTRGVLYLLLGGICAYDHNAEKIILSECGTTMYQPSFGLFDRITYTSDPIVQKSTVRLLHEFLNHSVNIITPFENNTKSEMFASSRRKDYLKNTHSCISSRFGCNLGCCYGCMIRRIGFIVADVDDCDYKYDLFTLKDGQQIDYYGKSTSDGRITNLLELMRFSLDIIYDYKSLDPMKRKRIDQYGKYDLFRRFALDTFSSLHILLNSGKTRLNTRIESSYHDALKYVDEEELIHRIEYVRSL